MSDKVVFRKWGESAKASPAPEPIQPVPVQPGPIRPEPVHRAPRPKRTPRPVPPEPVRVTDGYFQIPNTVLDDILPTLHKDDQLVYLRLLRLTWGFRRETCDVTTRRLTEKTGVKRTALFESLARLEGRGLVRRVAAKLTGPLDERWNTYTATVPGVEPPWKASGPDGSAARTDAGAGHMKETPKETSKEQVYRVREIALRVKPLDAPLDLTHLRIALAGQGIEWDEATVAEAVSVLT